MTLTTSELVHHILCVAGWLVFHGALCWACESKDMKDVLLHCSPYLGCIHTAILKTTDRNYTLTCREYKKYITCIEKRMVFVCPNAIVREGPLYEDYQDTKLLYSSMPFNCSMPEIIKIQLREKHQQQQRQRLTTTPSSGAHTHYTTSWILIGYLLMMSSVICSFRNIAVT